MTSAVSLGCNLFRKSIFERSPLKLLCSCPSTHGLKCILQHGHLCCPLEPCWSANNQRQNWIEIYSDGFTNTVMLLFHTQIILTDESGAWTQHSEQKVFVTPEHRRVGTCRSMKAQCHCHCIRYWLALPCQIWSRVSDETAHGSTRMSREVWTSRYLLEVT